MTPQAISFRIVSLNSRVPVVESTSKEGPRRHAWWPLVYTGGCTFSCKRLGNNDSVVMMIMISDRSRLLISRPVIYRARRFTSQRADAEKQRKARYSWHFNPVILNNPNSLLSWSSPFQLNWIWENWDDIWGNLYPASFWEETDLCSTRIDRTWWMPGVGYASRLRGWFL